MHGQPDGEHQVGEGDHRGDLIADDQPVRSGFWKLALHPHRHREAEQQDLEAVSHELIFHGFLAPNG